LFEIFIHVPDRLGRSGRAIVRSHLAAATARRQLGMDRTELLCTVGKGQFSENCRFTAGILDENARLKAGAMLGYLDAHPFPIPRAFQAATL
jgi:hypothetical protein